MRWLTLASLGVFFMASGAGAASWSVLSFQTDPQNAARIVAAGDALMSSPAGKGFPGRLILQQSVANGTDPTTHSWIPIYNSGAEREAFVQKLQTDPAWQTFLGTVTKLTDPTSQVMYRTVKSWGDVQDSDSVWMTHAFTVNDPQAFVAALEKFRASPTGQSFQGQVHLSAVVAGGMSSVTHVISVGYASEAELEAWVDTRTASKDWADYVEASRPAAEYLGATMGRNVKSWGPATLQQLTQP